MNFYGQIKIMLANDEAVFLEKKLNFVCLDFHKLIFWTF